MISPNMKALPVEAHDETQPEGGAEVVLRRVVMELVSGPHNSDL